MQVLSTITALKKLCNHPKLIHDAIRQQQAGLLLLVLLSFPLPYRMFMRDA
jgi:hypothetical protein